MDLVLVLKASLLLSAALAVARLQRRAPAVSRHRLWTIAFAALLALPLLAAGLPRVAVPVPEGWRSSVGASLDRADVALPGGAAADRQPALTLEPAPGPTSTVPGNSAAPVEWFQRVPFRPDGVRHTASARGLTATALLATWLLGTIVSIAALTLSLVRVWQLSRWPPNSRTPGWQSAAACLGGCLGIGRRRGCSSALVLARRWPSASGVRSSSCRSSLAPGARSSATSCWHTSSHTCPAATRAHLVARLAVAVYWCSTRADGRAGKRRYRGSRRATRRCSPSARPSSHARVLLDIASMPHSRSALGALPMVEHRSPGETKLMTYPQHHLRPRPGLRPQDHAAFKQLEAAGRIRMYQVGVSLDPDVLWFNLGPGGVASPGRALLARKEFRQAISLGVDRQAIADGVYLGAAVPISGLSRPGTRSGTPPALRLRPRRGQGPGAPGRPRPP